MMKYTRPKPGCNRSETMAFRLSEEEYSMLERLADAQKSSRGMVLRRMLTREWNAWKERVLAIERARKIAANG